jgi:hypothetical protein
MIQTVCKLGKRIRCAARHGQSIVRKHDALAGLENAVTGALQHPRYIRLSKEDDRVFLYYAQTRSTRQTTRMPGTYLTDRIKKGVTVYETDSDHL